MGRAALAVLTVLALALAAAVAPAASAAEADSAHCAGGAGGGGAQASSLGAIPPPDWDQDCDGIDDAADNCPPTRPDDFANRNPDQTDTDGDGRGDKCDD